MFAPIPMTCPRCWGSRVERAAQVPCCYCRGAGVVDDQALSPHFMLSELLHSEVAARAGIPNDPPTGFTDRLRELAEQLLEPIREEFGPLHVNSGYRSPAVNAAVPGSSPTSAHQLAYAADLRPLEATRHEVINWLARGTIGFDQVIHEGTWVHVGIFSPSGAQRRGVLMMFGGEYFPYDPADPRVQV